MGKERNRLRQLGGAVPPLTAEQALSQRELETALQALRRRYPPASATVREQYRAEPRLGPALAARVYGPRPSTAPDHAERAG